VNAAAECDPTERQGSSIWEAARRTLVELVRNLVAHGDAGAGKWRGNWRME